MSMLGGCTGINYYMFAGGTHFSGWGARGMTTSYDYNAAIHESGAVGDKYLAAKGLGEFLHKYESQLVRSTGGPCKIEGVPESVFGGVRMAKDGTLFVFLHNTDTGKLCKGKATLLPGKIQSPRQAMYNIDQNGNKVLMQVDESQKGDSLAVSPIQVTYELGPLDTKVLVIPVKKNPEKGVWWPEKQSAIERPSRLPAPVRIASVKRREDSTEKAQWIPLSRLVSLPDLGINDFRYSLYRAKVNLSRQQVENEKYLLFNMFTRDIVSVQVNGKNVVRLFPDKADAQTWTTRNCFDRIRPDEYDNRFDVSGTLQEGENEILVVYENLGHAHGYVPMEELSGIREAGLSVSETALSHPLEWEYAADAAGVTEGWILPRFDDGDWSVVPLDIRSEIPRKGNGIQPVAEQDGLLTWYRIEFTLPSQNPSVWIPWLMRINASGNGFMWLNGHNIGRHWEAGPQREFYLPECWLNFGKDKKNVLVLGLRQTVNGSVIKSMEIAPYRDAAEMKKQESGQMEKFNKDQLPYK